MDEMKRRSSLSETYDQVWTQKGFKNKGRSTVEKAKNQVTEADYCRNYQ